MLTIERINSLREQIKYLQNQLTNEENKVAIIISNKETITDALEWHKNQISSLDYRSIPWDMPGNITSEEQLSKPTDPTSQRENRPGVTPVWKEFYRAYDRYLVWSTYLNQGIKNKKRLNECKALLTELANSNSVAPTNPDFFANLTTALNSAVTTLDILAQCQQELTEVKKQKSDLETKLTTHENTLNNTRSLLDKANSELTQKQQQLTEITEDLDNIQRQKSSLQGFLSIEFENKTQEIINQLTEGEEKEKIKKRCAHLMQKYDELTGKSDRGENVNIIDITDAVADLFDQKEKITILLQIQLKEQEIAKLTKKSKKSTAPLRQELAELKKQLEKKNKELETKARQVEETKNKSQKLEGDIASLLISTSLLTKQLEAAGNELTESQQNETRIKIEAELKDNLLQQKEIEIKEKDNTISTHENQINNYQQLLRKSEESIVNCKKIITAKDEELTKLEEQKEKLAEELEQTQEKIAELEANYLTSQTQITELQVRIAELEKDNSKDTEITRLKQQLITEKKKSQQFTQEVKKIQDQLTLLEKREQQLSTNIKILESEKIILEETIAKTSSFNWKKGGVIGFIIVLVTIFIYWIYRRIKN